MLYLDSLLEHIDSTPYSNYHILNLISEAAQFTDIHSIY